jgi:hypothetical protein
MLRVGKKEALWGGRWGYDDLVESLLPSFFKVRKEFLFFFQRN